MAVRLGSWVLALAACGHAPHGVDPGDDAPPGGDAAVDDAPPGDAPEASFWPTCGTASIDATFLNDRHAPFVIAHDGTLYGAARANGGTVIGRERPGMPAEPTWVTVSTTQLDAVEALAPAPDGTLYMTGFVNAVHAVYTIAPSGAIAMLGDPLPAGTDNFAYAEVGAGALYIAAFDRRDILRVDLATGARTVAVPGDSSTGIMHFTFMAPSTLLVASLNTGAYTVTLDASGNAATTTPFTRFGAEQVYRWGVDQTGRIYGQVERNNLEVLVRVDLDDTQHVLTGNYHWSHFAFGKGALRCDIAITSVNSPIDFVIPSDQTPSRP